ncbi:Ohr subfamily peroxiredoxin [Streptacidiphilus pinicola]|uniref:Ohr subfamily peroxiredoxin n=1 Tax=Streptacidiphilus pinicola TaxID=2219663 RepID=A0A2X0IEY3_9ACTN|nr:organic hydroperoxide resistance protein [Streptacidiphilus pinicola]RAG82173.1 Ohr subfamily peroxiredoxin [Streptacidiphilus pinicola]
MDTLYTATVTATGRDGRAVSSDGQLEVKLAFPPALGGDGKGTNPEQLLAAGWAACFTSTLGVVGREAKIATGKISVTAEIGIGKDDTDGGFALTGVLRVKLPEDLQNETGRKLVEQAHAGCPYSKATRGNIPVELIIE